MIRHNHKRIVICFYIIELDTADVKNNKLNHFNSNNSYLGIKGSMLNFGSRM